MKPSLIAALALVLGTGLLAGGAQAQWQWRDNNGRMVISDQPPPTDIPIRNILRGPGKASTSAPPAPAAPAGASPPADPATANKQAVPAAQKSFVEKERELRKQQLAAAEAAKKAEEAAAQAKAKQTACSGMRGNLAALQSGQRISQTSEKGERTYLDDAQRAAEIERMRQQISETCT